MPDKINNTTFSGIDSSMILQLKEIASPLIGSLSISALIRHIAKYGKVIDGQLIVEGWSSVDYDDLDND